MLRPVLDRSINGALQSRPSIRPNIIIVFFHGRHMAYHSIDDLKYDPKLAEALGHMLVAWSNAERALQSVIMCIIGLDAIMTAAAYYRIPAFESRVKFIKALLSEWDTSTYDKAAIEREIESLRSLSTTRNNWVHNFWCREHGTDKTVIFDYREEQYSQKRRKPVKSADVLGHVQAVQQRTVQLLGLVPLP